MRQPKKSRAKFWARFGPALAVFVLAIVLQSRGSGTIKALAPIDVLTAGVTAAFLKLTGMPVQQEAAVLSHPAGFSYEIYYKCTGLILVLFLSAALLALPGRWGSRIKNVIFGAVFVLTLNFMRLTGLFYIGVRCPRAFDLFHGILFEVAMLGFVLGFWLLSLRRAGSRPAPFY
ncbi:MAG: archaeosortase/exosortase family protein [Candidatus Aminicenantes bacterium]|nr:archaeosortase/exosortase family protein [Candidatus Aminicenantes bacterium]